MSEETKWKVGDKLAFGCGSSGKDWVIHEITKITKTGRMKCGPYELNPDLSVRGQGSGFYRVHRAHPITKEIRDSVIMRKCIRKISDFDFKLLDKDRLLRIVSILEEVSLDSREGTS
jgi:hypothetical protein